ncbi:MAG: IS3 family transposase, partial [Treponema sp.]|nr:IS3 family transposase [Treponema sp.]
MHIFEIKRPDIIEKAAGRDAAALEAKLREKDNLIAELAQEALTFKKTFSGRKPEIGRAKMSLQKRQMIEREVERLHVKTGIGALTLAGFAGVSGRTWREWQGRQ